MKLSARNQLNGKVISITAGAVETEVVIELRDGQQVVSVITRSSAEGMDLKVGDYASALFKATSVILGK